MSSSPDTLDGMMDQMNVIQSDLHIEGTRSRTGKLLPPKFGILSFLLDSVLSGRVDDAIICPVSTQYDKVIEVE
jgi:glycerol-3-phosphate O-acyltransferase